MITAMSDFSEKKDPNSKDKPRESVSKVPGINSANQRTADSSDVLFSSQIDVPDVDDNVGSTSGKDKISYKERQEKISQNTQPSDRASTSTTHSHESRKSAAETKTISSYLEYTDFLKNFEVNKSLYIFFCGSNSPNSGYSWCQQCSQALPLVEQALKHVYNSIFLIVTVGLKEDWQNKSNPYRLDKHLKLKVVPTLLKYETPKRLEGEYCLKPELLELLFEDDTEGF